VNLHAVLTHYPVRGQILAFEMHVDRHVMFGAASTDRRDEINRRHAATFLDQVERLIGYKQFHDLSKHVYSTNSFQLDEVAPKRETTLFGGPHR
jgi:hypothetical protein